jgi:hypothetical protein
MDGHLSKNSSTYEVFFLVVNKKTCILFFFSFSYTVWFGTAPNNQAEKKSIFNFFHFLYKTDRKKLPTKRKKNNKLFFVFL